MAVKDLAMLLVRRRERIDECSSAQDYLAAVATATDALEQATRDLIAARSPLMTKLTQAGLDALSVQMFGLAALPEFYPIASRLVTGTAELTRITVECALGLFPGDETAVIDRLRSNGQLQSAGLLELDPPVDSVPLPARRLKCPERVVQYLLGVSPELPAELRAVAHFDIDCPPCEQSAEPVAEAIFDHERVLLFPAETTVAGLLTESSRIRSRRLLRVDTRQLFDSPQFEAALTALTREQIFSDHLTVFENLDASPDSSLAAKRWPALSRQMRRYGSAIAFVGAALPQSIARELDVENGDEFLVQAAK